MYANILSIYLKIEGLIKSGFSEFSEQPLSVE